VYARQSKNPTPSDFLLYRFILIFNSLDANAGPHGVEGHAGDGRYFVLRIAKSQRPRVHTV